MDTFCHRRQIFRQRRGCSQLDICPVLICHLALHVHIAVADEVELNSIGHILINLSGHAVDLDILALKVLAGRSGGTVVQFLLDIALQICHKVLVAFTGNDRKQVDIMHTVATALHIHTIAVLVYAQTQTTAHFLALGGLAVRMFQRANLEYVRVIPAFPKGRVGEDEPGRLFKGEQPFLVFQNQVIGRDIIRELTTALRLAVDAASGLFVDAEITFMNSRRLPAELPQILLVRCIFQCEVLVLKNVEVLFLEHLAVFAQLLVAIFIILAVLGDLVDEEQGERFDAHVEVLLFLFKMGKNRLTDLDAAHTTIGFIVDHIASMKNFPIGEGHRATQRVDFRNGIATVLLHALRNMIQIIFHAQNTGFSVDGLTIPDFHLDTSHGRLFGRKDNLFQKQIAIGPPEVLDLKAFDLDFLDQTLVVSIQRIQNVDHVVLDGMSSGIVQAEQRIKVLQSLLGDGAAHLLGFVQNQDRPVGLDDINGTAGSKLITLGVDDSRLLAFTILFQGRGKSLSVDNHDLNAAACRESIQLVQVLAVVDEEAGLFAIVLHEMVSHHIEALFDAFSNGNRRHHHNELAPAIHLVQLEHGFDVHIGFARSGFHLNIQAAPPQAFHQLRRQLDIVLALDAVDILQQLVVAEIDFLIFEAGIILSFPNGQLFRIILKCISGRLGHNSQVTDIVDTIMVALSGKYFDYCINSVSLVLLDFEVKFHFCFSSFTNGSSDFLINVIISSVSFALQVEIESFVVAIEFEISL